VAIPTAIAAFYLPVTLMCLLYFRIYRETVKRRKELHLLQAQHHKSYSQSTTTTNNNNNNTNTNNTTTNSNGRLTKTFSTIGAASINEHDESISTDSNRSHGKIKSMQNSSIKKLILSNKRQKNQFNETFNCCCYTKYVLIYFIYIFEVDSHKYTYLTYVCIKEENMMRQYRSTSS
jgi:hypothetical protein